MTKWAAWRHAWRAALSGKLSYAGETAEHEDGPIATATAAGPIFEREDEVAFTFKSVGHYLASAYGVYKKALQFIDVEGAKLVGFEPLAEGVAAATGIPQAVVIERAGEAALGIVMALVHSAETATGEAQKVANDKLANLSEDAALIADFKALYASSKADLAKLGFPL